MQNLSLHTRLAMPIMSDAEVKAEMDKAFKKCISPQLLQKLFFKIARFLGQEEGVKIDLMPVAHELHTQYLASKEKELGKDFGLWLNLEIQK